MDGVRTIKISNYQFTLSQLLRFVIAWIVFFVAVSNAPAEVILSGPLGARNLSSGNIFLVVGALLFTPFAITVAKPHIVTGILAVMAGVAWLLCGMMIASAAC